MSLLSDSDKKHLSAKIRLNRGEDYVILKTGTAENPLLVVFPNTPDDSIRLINVLYVIAVLGPIIALGVLLSLLRDSKTLFGGLLPATEQQPTATQEEDVVIAGPAQDEV